MKNLKPILVICLLLISLISCKKGEKGDPGPAGPSGPQGQNGQPVDSRLYNKWEVISGLPGTKYIIIMNDNTFYYLYEDEIGFKRLDYGTGLVSSSQLAFKSLYNYSISNDTLKLTNDHEVVFAKRNDSAPNGSDWVILFNVNAMDSMQAPINYVTDMAWDGQFLWYGYPTGAYLLQINLSLNIFYYHSLQGPHWPSAMAYDGSYFWINDVNHNNVWSVNPSTGNVVKASTTIESKITGLAWDGQFLWCWGEDTVSGSALYKYDPITNSVDSPIHIYVSAGGLEYANGYLYMCSGKTIQKCSLNPLHVEKVYQLNYGNAKGIAFDGTNFWVSSSVYDSGSGNTKYMIYKVALN